MGESVKGDFEKAFAEDFLKGFSKDFGRPFPAQSPKKGICPESPPPEKAVCYLRADGNTSVLTSTRFCIMSFSMRKSWSSARPLTSVSVTVL